MNDLNRLREELSIEQHYYADVEDGVEYILPIDMLLSIVDELLQIKRSGRYVFSFFISVPQTNLEFILLIEKVTYVVSEGT